MGDPATFIKDGANIAHSLHRVFAAYASNPFLGTRSGGSHPFNWRTYADIGDESLRLACALKDAGVTARSHIGFCSENRSEWIIADFAACLDDLVSVGLHVSWPEETLKHVLPDADVAAVVADGASLPSIHRIATAGLCPKLRLIVAMDDVPSGIESTKALRVVRYADLVDKAKHGQHACNTHTGAGAKEVDASAVARPGEETEAYTLMYSSGTTGTPKGMLVSKKRWAAQAVAGGVAICPERVAASYLALAHGADRGIVWQTAWCGGRIGICRESHEELLADLRALQPRFFLGMPGFWNRLYADYQVVREEKLGKFIEERVRKERGAIATGRSVACVMRGMRRLPEWQEAMELAATLRAGAEEVSRALFAVRQSVGGELVLAVTGGARTSDAVLAWMPSCLVPGNDCRVKDAYGSTEFPGISSNGEIPPGVEVKLEAVPELGYTPLDLPWPRGEILVRRTGKDAEKQQYWKREDLTKDAFDEDGWYHTGDIGMLDYSEAPLGDLERIPLLRIIDRRKDFIELYVDGDSKWVSIGQTGVFLSLPEVSNVCLFGDRMEASPVAVVVPSATFSPSGPPALAMLEVLRNAAKIAGLKPHEVPAAVIIEDGEPWSAENGWLSAIGKPKRGALEERYREQIRQAYTALSTSAATPPASQEPWVAETAAALTPGAAALLDAQRGDDRMFLMSLIEDLRREVAIEAQEEPAKQDLKGFGGPGGRDILEEFEFHVNGFERKERVDKAWEGLRQRSRYNRIKGPLWRKEREDKVAAARKAVQSALEDGEARRQAVLEILTASSGSMAADDVARCVAELRDAKARVMVAYAGETCANVKPEEEMVSWAQWRDAVDELEIVGAACNTQVPFIIRGSPTWVAPPIPAGQEAPPPPAISFGEAKVWCCGCGRLIEEEESQMDRPRFHCLDHATGGDRCPECHHVAAKLRQCAAAALASSASEDVVRMRAALDAWDPHALCPMVRDKGHIIHLQHNCKRGWGDTPASLLVNACVQYAERLALGMPDPDVVLAVDDVVEGETVVRPPYPSSPLARAAQIDLVCHSGYRWLTYANVAYLSERVAKLLVSLDLEGQFVGISGYNTFEWAVTDFACARAGCASVGVHTTFDNDGAALVMNTAGVAALVASADLFPSGGRGPGRWSVADVAGGVPTLKAVVVMDAGVEEARRALPPDCELSLSSMCDAVAPGKRADLDAVDIGDPFQKKGAPHAMADGTVVDVFTLLFTSGSSGKAKGVIVTPQTFFNDVSEKVFCPLATASYIPLSHSSDRMKVWEFLGNGGRVGFAYYEASNWAAHETSKKDAMVASLGASTNNVVGLFRQVEHLSPTAMACPPRIWNGLYALYQMRLQRGLSEEDAAASIRKMFGRNITSLATGGAPTAKEVVAWAKRIFPDCSFVDAYGATECGAITSNGRPVFSKGVEVRLVDVPELGFVAADAAAEGKAVRGEIVVRSPNMNPGYFKLPDETAAAFVDGWYRTGDLGSFDNKGILTVIERVSAVASLSDGTIVYPGRIEKALEACSSVAQVFVHVDPARPRPVALVVPKPDAAKVFAEKNGVVISEGFYAPGSEFAKSILKEFAEQGLSHVEVPTAVGLCQEEWSESNGLLTGGMQKKVRKQFPIVFADLLAQL